MSTPIIKSLKKLWRGNTLIHINYFKKYMYFRSTGLLCSRKPEQLDAKTRTHFLLNIRAELDEISSSSGPNTENFLGGGR